MKTSGLVWVAGAVIRQPLYASLVGLGAATEVAVAVGTLVPALLMSDGKPKGDWISGLVGLVKVVKAVVGGFDPVKASERSAGLSRNGALDMACCGLAMLADKFRHKLGTELDAMDASSSRGNIRKAWRDSAARAFQASADTAVKTVLDEPQIALKAIGEKIRGLRAARGQEILIDPARGIKY